MGSISVIDAFIGYLLACTCLLCDAAERKEAAHPSVRGVEPAAVRGAAHHTVLRVGDAGRPLLPRRRRRGRAVQDISLTAAAEVGREGTALLVKISVLVSSP
jgi:hypothetical protein